MIIRNYPITPRKANLNEVEVKPFIFLIFLPDFLANDKNFY